MLVFNLQRHNSTIVLSPSLSNIKLKFNIPKVPRSSRRLQKVTKGLQKLLKVPQDSISRFPNVRSAWSLLKSF